MDYALTGLGHRNFEHLTQALALKVLTPALSVFGDGPDGGREATWNGEATSLSSARDWDGYGVVQAKFKVHDSDPATNLTWLKDAITSELGDWAKADTLRLRKPDFLLFVSNVRLSPDPRAGKDAARDHMRSKIETLKLPIKDFRIWDFDDLRSLLDGEDAVRDRYAAFITPGDLIADILREREWARNDFAEAMHGYVAKALVDDDLLNLTQAGTAGDNRIAMADVFIDLPYDVDGRAVHHAAKSAKRAGSMQRGGGGSGNAIAAHFLAAVDEVPALDTKHEEPDRFVLIGGPGQGKSTITQWIAQVYRARFLSDTDAGKIPAVATVIERIHGRLSDIGSPVPGGRRWPFRVILSDLAEHLVRNPNHSLIEYIAKRIEARSSLSVEPTDIRRWIKEIPALLLIDGLDEVPESSNRADVMRCIRDFFVDVGTMRADVAAIATTRPQGYSDEFSPLEYLHLRLTALGVDQAMKYASSLVAIRAGSGTDQYEKVIRRLRDAAEEESTGRFFETPLQVTILTVLLEKLGKAPRDRSRLFSTYYEVIAQREQEKSGHLSSLLQRYESDVLELHRRIGLLLQTRAAEAGETTATLPPIEFQTLIAAQFERHGHGVEDVEELQRQFTQLITDRLVFLSVVQADRIGFELRSLQEFMAAEELVARKEEEILPALREYAPIPYWRNVILFAVGSIFARREHLRAEVVLLCIALNSADQASSVTLPGSEVALDILLDGSCDSMPIYSSPIAEVAIQLLNRPSADRLAELAILREPAVRSVILAGASDLSPASPTIWLNRVLLLDSLAVDGVAEAVDALTRSSGYVPEADLRAILPSICRAEATAAAFAFEQRLTSADPADLLDSAHPMGFYDEEELASPLWLQHLRSLVNIDTSEQVEGPLVARYVPLGRHGEAWTWVAQTDGGDARWEALRGIARFSLQPTAQLLADALRTSAAAPRGILPAATPWPLTACIRDAGERKKSGDESDSSGRSDRLVELAHLAETGVLGDHADWVRAEALVPAVQSVTLDQLADAGDRATARRDCSGQPPLRGDSDVPLGAMYFSVGNGHPGRRGDMGSTIRGLMQIQVERGDSLGDLFGMLALSAAGLEFSSYPRVSREELSEERRELAADVFAWAMRPLGESILGAGWLGWLRGAEFLEWDDQWIPPLEQLGRSRRLSLASHFAVLPRLVDLTRNSLVGPGIARLAMAIDPSLVTSANLPALESRLRTVPGDAEAAGALLDSLEVLTSAVDPWHANLESTLARLLDGKDDLGMQWLHSAVGLLPSGATDLAARLARDLSWTTPTWASRFMDVAVERQGKRTAVTRVA